MASMWATVVIHSGRAAETIGFAALGILPNEGLVKVLKKIITMWKVLANTCLSIASARNIIFAQKCAVSQGRKYHAHT
jgi:hypothetical protein